MKKITSLLFPILLATVGLSLLYIILFLITGPQSVILQPEGEIADKQKELIIFTTLLMLVIVIPVFILTAAIVIKYREKKKATYTPNWDHHRGLEFLWWGLPLGIIVILGIVTWHTSHDLDPYKPLTSNTKPVKVQVIALEWKWLFIYPEQRIATVNYLKFPEKTPLNLELTSDAPMNSFWIPKLGGQVYTMNGMTTKLHLSANSRGIYDGSSANLSGEGFSEMRFKAYSVSKESFREWVSTTQKSSKRLSYDTYQDLTKPTKKVSPIFYTLGDGELYNKIIMKYMAPENTPSESGEHY